MAITPVGFTGTVTEVDFAKMMNAVGGYGILGTYNGTDFSVTRVAGSRTVLVQGQPSDLWAPGVLVTMDADASPTASAANTSSNPRIDLLVMRVNWSTHACALTIIPGTPLANPEPPAYNRTPGEVFDVPLAEMTLLPSGADYLAANIRDRRVWLQDGVMAQPDDRVLPDTFPGRLVALPDDGRLIMGGFGQERHTIQPDSDTGWVTVPITAPPGFGGSVKGRIRNGMTKLAFNWTKTGTGTGGTITFGNVFLPNGWRPGGGVDIVETLWAGANPCRLYISADDGEMGFNNVNMAAGQIIQGSPVFHYQYALL